MKIKYLYVLIITMLIMPLVVNAETTSVSINCSPNEVNAGNSSACLIKGSSDFDVSRVVIDVSHDGGASFGSYLDAAGFSGSFTNNKIDVSRAENDLVTGGFNIGTLNVSTPEHLGSGTNSVNITLQNVTFYDAEGNEFSASPISTSINVIYGTDLSGLKSLNIINGTLTPAFAANIYEYEVTLRNWAIGAFGFVTETNNSSDTITLVNSDTNEPIADRVNVLFVPAGDTGKMTIKMNVGSATYTFIVTRPAAPSVEPSTPTDGNSQIPSDNTSGNTQRNPQTGGSAITMALVLIISFSLSIYLYKKNIEGYN